MSKNQLKMSLIDYCQDKIALAEVLTWIFDNLVTAYNLVLGT